MVVTFVVFHWERSELNTDADRNAVEVNPKQVKKKKNEEMGKGEKTEFKGRNKERKNKSSAVDVLLSMVVTFAVSHLERSELNADAA